MPTDKIKAARAAIGGFIQARREAMGVTREDLGKHVGITANTVKGVETGRFAMDIDLQFLIYEALEIKPYFSTTEPPLDHPPQHGHTDQYHGFYISENILLHPAQLAIVKLTHPRLFVRFNYPDTLFTGYDDWKANHAEVSWLDANDKPTTPEEVDSILTDCWNFLCLHEQKEEEIYGAETDEY